MPHSVRTSIRIPALLAATLAVLVGACSLRQSDLDAAGREFVVLALALGTHDANFVDAYYGPDSLRAVAEARAPDLDIPSIRAAAESLLVALGGSARSSTDTLVALRHANLRGQLVAMIARARFLEGDTLSFTAEAEALFGVLPPSFTDAHFDSLLAELDRVLPGRGALATRLQRFRARLVIPEARLDTVFKRAIAECRVRTLAHVALPAVEAFDLEYVKGTSWNAYNCYKGGYKSLIQVNTDFPTPIERALDLACHEGYPGHHVYNALIEETLVNGRGWVEFSLYPLFSPQSLIAEGSANYGVDLAFPGEARTAFERDSLFPLAGLDPRLAAQNTQVRLIVEQLNFARNEVAQRYLDGSLDRAGAEAAMTRYWLSTPEQAAKTVRFIDTYRSYVINYNYGRELVRAWVERNSADDPGARWQAFEALLRAPAPAMR
jgi:hypothetical protein